MRPREAERPVQTSRTTGLGGNWSANPRPWWPCPSHPPAAAPGAPGPAALTSERGLGPLTRGQLQVLGHGWGAHRSSGQGGRVSNSTSTVSLKPARPHTAPLRPGLGLRLRDRRLRPLVPGLNWMGQWRRGAGPALCLQGRGLRLPSSVRTSRDWIPRFSNLNSALVLDLATWEESDS